MNRQLRWGILLVAIGLLFSLNGSAQTFTDEKAVGSGRVETNCIHTLVSGCTITATGQVAGTPITAGAIILRLDTGGPQSTNGSTNNTPQGVCVPAAGAAAITETGGDTLTLNTVGTVCEEENSSSPYQYTGTYRITGGTGRFALAKGTGNVSAAYTREGTFTRGAGDALFSITGSISY